MTIKKPRQAMYKVVQIWPGQTATCLDTISPGHIWTTLYVWRNIEAPSRNHCCWGKSVRITYVCVFARAPECVCVWGGGLTGVCVRACSLTIPACKAPPYCHLRPLWLHHICRHYLIKDAIFGKRMEHKMCVLIFSTTFISNIYHSKKNLARYCHKCEKVFM